MNMQDGECPAGSPGQEDTRAREVVAWLSPTKDCSRKEEIIHHKTLRDPYMPERHRGVEATAQMRWCGLDVDRPFTLPTHASRVSPRVRRPRLKALMRAALEGGAIMRRSFATLLRGSVSARFWLHLATNLVLWPSLPRLV